MAVLIVPFDCRSGAINDLATPPEYPSKRLTVCFQPDILTATIKHLVIYTSNIEKVDS